MTRIWIVRHGATFEAGEPPRRIGRRTDLPLVKRGVAQAEALGESFASRGVTFDLALTSELQRALQTANIILALQPRVISLATAAWLNEIDHGPDEGQEEDAVVARLGSAALSLWDRRAVAPSGWCVDSQMRLTAWQEFLRDAIMDNILLVTSSGAARFALMAADLARDSLKLPIGSFGILERGLAHRWSIVAWGERPEPGVS